MSKFNMTPNGVIWTSVMWFTVLYTSLSTAQKPLQIRDLECYNDMESKMFCSWKVNSNSNCSEDFRLKYKIDNKIHVCQDMSNIDGDKCICTIRDQFFSVMDLYEIEIESQGTPVGKKSINVSTTIKPKTPSNISVDIGEADVVVVHWQTNYYSHFMKSRFCFEVEIICKQDNTRILHNVLDQVETQYKFSKRQLKRGYDYMVRVRTKMSEKQDLRGIPSEWSKQDPRAEWRNDYSLSVLELKSIIIPVSCILLLILIPSSYFCFSRCKNKWWNNIPDPAKSSLAQLLLIPKHQFKPDGKANAKLFKKYLSRTQKNRNSQHVQLTQKQNIPDYSKVNSDLKRNYFEPENENVESHVEMYPKIIQKPIPEDILEEKDDNPLLAMDFSIGRMFCDILGASSFQSGNTFEAFNAGNTFESFVCPSFMGQYNIDETRMSDVSPESGYQSYDSQNSPVDFSPTLYAPNTTYFDDWPSNQNDFSPYAPPFSHDESSSCVGKEVTFMNSGYNSFANALAEDKLVSNVDTAEVALSPNLCMDDSSQSMLFFPFNSNFVVKANNVCYYNIKHFVKVHNHGRDFGIIPKVSGYQSNQNKTGNTGFPLVGSDYQPFQSLLEPNSTSLNDDKNKENDQYHLRESVQNSEEPSEMTQVDESTVHISDFLQNDIPFALTFDICDHLRNLKSMNGNKIPLHGLASGRFPLNHALFPCHPEDATFIHDHLSIKKVPSATDFLPLKFQNVSYFLPLHQLSLNGSNQTSNQLLLQQNNMDKEGNSYMKIAL